MHSRYLIFFTFPPTFPWCELTLKTHLFWKESDIASRWVLSAVVDPGFLVKGPQPQGRCQPFIWPEFARKLHENEENSTDDLKLYYVAPPLYVRDRSLYDNDTDFL